VATQECLSEQLLLVTMQLRHQIINESSQLETERVPNPQVESSLLRMQSFHSNRYQVRQPVEVSPLVVL